VNHLQTAARITATVGLLAFAVVTLAGLTRRTDTPAPTPPDALADDLSRRLREDIQPLLETYCLKCHSGTEAKGDLRLDRLEDLNAALHISDRLRTVREMVITAEMPPRKAIQPSDHERLILTQWLDAVAAYVPEDAPIDPGWFTIHRLNRQEYRNTLRDLLGIDPAAHDLAAKLPQDDTGYGFDNNADVLTMSTLALEAYLDAAERAVEIALGPELTFGDHPLPTTHLENQAHGTPLERGGFMLYSNGRVEADVTVPASGEYFIRVEAWETHGGDAFAQLGLEVDARPVQVFEVSGVREKPQIIEVRQRLESGTHRIAARFLNDFYIADQADRNLAVMSISASGPLDELTTSRAAAWRQIFDAGRGISVEPQRAQAILSAFAQRAYRRPLAPAERDELGQRYGQLRAQGLREEQAIRMLLTATLVSPNFLYRTIDNPRSDDPLAVYSLSDHELASRLSYFLWSSMPDSELQALAAQDLLHDEATLRAQVERMLLDPRSEAFIQNFSGQWLQWRKLDSLRFDPALFPEYSDDLRSDFIREASLLFGDVVRSNRNIMDLLTSSDTFLNERLARFYGIDDVQGPEFRRITLPADSQRGGILTMGAVLAVTSNPTRTSPVKRGLFILDQILGTPPPPPPPDIPPLEQAAHAAAADSLRDQLAAHVANPTCAVCHNRLDPLGLAFEHFDAVGKWRDTESPGGRPIDSSAVLPDGTPLSGVPDLKQILTQRRDEFVETLTGRLLMYATGRGLEPFDRPALRQIAEQSRTQGDGLRSLIESIVLSETFRTCRGRPAPTRQTSPPPPPPSPPPPRNPHDD